MDGKKIFIYLCLYFGKRTLGGVDIRRNFIKSYGSRLPRHYSGSGKKHSAELAKRIHKCSAPDHRIGHLKIPDPGKCKNLEFLRLFG